MPKLLKIWQLLLKSKRQSLRVWIVFLLAVAQWAVFGLGFGFAMTSLPIVQR